MTDSFKHTISFKCYYLRVDHSSILRVVALEDLNHLVVVLADVLDVVADAVDCLLDVVIGRNDAVLELEAA